MPTGKDSVAKVPLKLSKKNKNSPRKGAVFVTNELDLPSRQDIASPIILSLAKEKSKTF
jgi:hypothetical protein